jgi:hypothetical protein
LGGSVRLFDEDGNQLETDGKTGEIKGTVLQFCKHSFANTALRTQLCKHSLANTALQTQLCNYGCANTALQIRLCKHSFANTALQIYSFTV